MNNRRGVCFTHHSPVQTSGLPDCPDGRGWSSGAPKTLRPHCPRRYWFNPDVTQGSPQGQRVGVPSARHSISAPAPSPGPILTCFAAGLAQGGASEVGISGLLGLSLTHAPVPRCRVTSHPEGSGRRQPFGSPLGPECRGGTVRVTHLSQLRDVRGPSRETGMAGGLESSGYPLLTYRAPGLGRQPRADHPGAHTGSSAWHGTLRAAGILNSGASPKGDGFREPGRSHTALLCDTWPWRSRGVTPTARRRSGRSRAR